MSDAAETSAEYIKHHLTNLTFGRYPEGHEHAGQWGFAHSPYAKSKSGFIHQTIQDRNHRKGQVNHPVLIEKGLSNDRDSGKNRYLIGSAGTEQDRELAAENYPMKEAAHTVCKNG